jgi:hypothetical protein
VCLNSLAAKSIAVLSRYLLARKSMPEMDAEHCQKNRHGGANVSRTNLLQFMLNSIVFYFCRTITDSMQASYSGHIVFFALNRCPWFFHWILVFRFVVRHARMRVLGFQKAKGEGDKGNEVIKRCS